MPTKSKQHSLKEEEYIITFFDIYSFSEMVKKIGAKNVYKKLKPVWKDIRQLSIDRNIRTFLFSDCGFALQNAGNGCADIGSDYIDFLVSLLNIYFEQQFYIRGWVSIGKAICTDDQILGEAVIECAKSEPLLQAPYIFISHNLLKQCSPGKPLVIKKIKLKNGTYKMGYPLIPMPEIDYLEHLRDWCEKSIYDETIGAQKASMLLDHLKEIYPANKDI